MSVQNDGLSGQVDGFAVPPGAKAQARTIAERRSRTSVVVVHHVCRRAFFGDSRQVPVFVSSFTTPCILLLLLLHTAVLIDTDSYLLHSGIKGKEGQKEIVMSD